MITSGQVVAIGLGALLENPWRTAGGEGRGDGRGEDRTARTKRASTAGPSG